MVQPRKILFFQYGDFAEAFERLSSGGAETYRDQRKSVDYVMNLDEASVIVSLSCSHDPVQLADNVTAIGLPVRDLTTQRVRDLVKEHAPDLIVLRTPHIAVLDVAARLKIPTLPCFADIFEGGGVRRRWFNWRLARLLASNNVRCVANHNLNASRSLASVLGVPADRIVPWDWGRVPCNPVAKTAPSNPPRAFFAGALSVEKGVGDCLQALAILKARGQTMLFSFAGGGQRDEMQHMADELGVSDQVTWLGTISNTDVREFMRSHDLVVVPSRHIYAEGLPNTIYEGLASRSPLIISDHPAFAGRISPDACLTFKAGDADDLATKMQAALCEPGLYERLSSASERAADKLYLGLEWGALMSKWLSDPHDHDGWVQKNSLQGLGF